MGTRAFPVRRRVIRELLQLPLGWDRFALQAARGLMRQYAGELYRADLLPLYPLHHELMYWLLRRRPEVGRSALKNVWRL